MADLTRLAAPPMGQDFEGAGGDAWKEFLYDAWKVLRLFHYGKGTPEAVVTAPMGHLYLNFEGGAGTTVWKKESGTGNTGWAAVA